MALPAPTNPAFTCQIECSNGEDELDAEAIHSMAPFAKIIFVHPSVPETIGMQGWPQVAQAIKMIADQHLADVISVSLGDGETAFINDPTNPTANQAAAVHSLDPAFLDAAVHHIPVMFASGDCGPTDPPVLGDTGQCTPATGVTAGHPVDNPWITAVGGTIPNAGPEHDGRAYRSGRAVDRPEQPLRRRGRRNLHHLPAAVMAGRNPGSGWPDRPRRPGHLDGRHRRHLAGLADLRGRHGAGHAAPARSPGLHQPRPGRDRAAKARRRASLMSRLASPTPPSA